MYYCVKKKHRTNYPNPITLENGEIVTVIEECKDKEEWKNWLFCEKKGKHRRGWVPKQILEIKKTKGTLKEDYSARELNVDYGEILEEIRELNNWVWCKRFREEEYGWVPLENLHLVEEKRTFDSLYKEALEAFFSGWDFSYLNGRMIDLQYLNWSYRGSIEFHLKKSKNLLDMGTGGGEFLKSLKNLPEEVFATEAYPPNIPIARKNLEPLGIKLIEKEENDNLNFDKNSLSLIINRHDNYNPSELYNILKPNGFFITQQVGELDNIELNHFFKDNSRDNNKWCLKNAVDELKKAGFSIFINREQFVPTLFTDIGAITYYFKAIQWQIPGLDIEDKRTIQKLKEMDKIMREKGGYITNQHRFFIIAYKK